MKVAFFSQDGQIEELVLQMDNLDCLFTSSTEELDAFLNESDTPILLFLDYDHDLEAAEALNAELIEDEYVIRVIITESLSLKELKEHQISEVSAHGYIRKPLNIDIVNGVLNDFELAEHVIENNLTEEGADIGTPELTFIGLKNPLLEEQDSEEEEEEDDTEEEVLAKQEDSTQEMNDEVPKQDRTEELAPMKPEDETEDGLVFEEERDEEVSEELEFGAEAESEEVESIEEEEATGEVDFNANVMKMDTQVKNILDEHGIYMSGGVDFETPLNQSVQAKFDAIFGVRQKNAPVEDQGLGIDQPSFEEEQAPDEGGISLDLGGGEEEGGLDLGGEEEGGLDLGGEEDGGLDLGGEEDAGALDLGGEENGGLDLGGEEDAGALDLGGEEDAGELDLGNNEEENNEIAMDLGGSDEEVSMSDHDKEEDTGLEFSIPEEEEDLSDDLEFGSDEAEGEELDLGGEEEGGLDLGGEEDAGELDLGGEEEGGLDLGGEEDAGELDLGGEEDAGELDLGGEEEGGLDLGGEEDAGELDLGGEEDAGELDLGGEEDAGELDLGAEEEGGLDLGAEEEDIDEFSETTNPTVVMDTKAGGELDDLVAQASEENEAAASDSEEGTTTDELDLGETTDTGTENIQNTISSIVEEEIEEEEFDIPEATEPAPSDADFNEFNYAGTEEAEATEETVLTQDEGEEVGEATNPTVVISQPIEEEIVASEEVVAEAEEEVVIAEEEVVEAPTDEDATVTQAIVTNTDIGRPAPEMSATEPVQETKTEEAKEERIPITPEEKRTPSLYNEDELLRHQATIRQLREEREALLAEVNKMKSQVEILDQENLGLKAELDEAKIEISILKKRHYSEIDELKYQLRLSNEKKDIYEERSKNFQKEFERLNQKVRIDFNQVKQREKELESQLELVRMDSESQVQSRDSKILELKRKIDALEFNMENVSIREQKSREDKAKLEERLSKIMKTLRGSIKNIEDDLDLEDELIDRIEKER